MKRNIIGKIFALVITVLTLSLMLNIGVGVSAEGVDESVDLVDESGTSSDDATEISDKSDENALTSGEGAVQTEEKVDGGGDYEQNLFEEIYEVIELNADKIFSVLAFVGTLIVGLGYKSGLLPLLRDALSKLKGAIDGVKADSETAKAETGERLREISCAVESIEEQLSAMKWQYESYEDICRDRESLRLILQGQIDMLYSIFMTSALPQYQKDEVGERISEMREELKNYESGEKN